jgi:DNA-directed RNA polymerase specialized sigma24 family protein
MRKLPASLPDIDSGYMDQYGEIDIEVYSAASSIWPFAHSFAVKIAFDEVQALDFMLRTIARVSKRRRQQDINHLNQYLMFSYKRLVLEECRHSKRLQTVLVEDNETADEDAARVLERAILISELMSKMDEETTKIYEQLVLGYSFNEIAAHGTLSAHVLRNKFRRRLAQLAEEIQREGKDQTLHRRRNGNSKKQP